MAGPMMLDAPNFGDAALVDLPADRPVTDYFDPDNATSDQAGAMHDLISASADQVRLAGAMSSRLEALAQAADNRIETVRRVTGDELRNPYRDGYAAEARTRIAAQRWDQAHAAAAGLDVPDAVGIAQQQVNIFNEKIDAIAQNNPDKAPALQFYQPIEDQAGAIASNAEDAAGVAQQRARDLHLDGGTIFINTMLGSMWGARRDPLTLGSLVFGPTASTGRTALARIASSAVAQGLFNVGLDVVQHPAVEQWRRDRGREAEGMLPSLAEVGTAFALGAIPGAGFQALGEAARMGGRVIAAGDRSIAADRLVLDDRPPGVPQELHEAAAGQAIMHTLDPANEPPPPVVPITAYHGSPHDFEAFSLDHVGAGQGAQSYGHGLYFAENEQVARTYTDLQPAAGHTAETLAHQYLTTHADRADALGTLTADIRAADPDSSLAKVGPAAWQLLAGGDVAAPGKLYKARIDADPDRMLDWDKPVTDQSDVVKRAISKVYGIPPDKMHDQIFVRQANAEQSAGLAREGVHGIKYLDQGSRSAGSGTHNFVIFDGQRVRVIEKNGVPVAPTDAPAAAALASARDPIAAVEALRADPALTQSALISPRADLQRAGHLASLSDEAWGLVRDGQVDPQHGVIASELGVAPENQASVLEHVRDLQPRDTKEAALMVADAAERRPNMLARFMAERETEAKMRGTMQRPIAEAAAASSGPRDLVPWTREDGSPVLVKPDALENAGERHGLLADLVRSCK